MLNSLLSGLTPEQRAAMESHLDLLERWNKTINLTAIKSRAEAMQKHIGESIFLASHLPPGSLSICDLGSGGGFPGIPVAIARPDCEIALIESDIRKGVFLREASRNLPNVSVVTKRFEAVEGEFDWLISRAVNLEKVSGGPNYKHAAFLGTIPGWHQIPLPWDPKSFLSIL